MTMELTPLREDLVHRKLLRMVILSTLVKFLLVLLVLFLLIGLTSCGTPTKAAEVQVECANCAQESRNVV